MIKGFQVLRPINKLTPLMEIVKCDDITINDLRNLNSYICKKDNYNKTALMYYCSNHRILDKDIINFFLDEINLQDKTGKTALMYYCRNKYVSIDSIKLLSNEIGLKDKKGKTALMYFLIKNKNITPEIINQLEIEIGEINNNNLCSLHYYIITNYKLDKKIIEVLNKELDITIEFTKTMLMHYFEFNKNPSIDIIKTFFYKQIGFQDIDGNSSLIYYLKNNKIPSIEIIKFLKNEIGIQNNKGKTALMYYIRNAQEVKKSIINLLDFEIGIKDIDNKTSLLYYTEKYLCNSKLHIIKSLSNEIGEIDKYNNSNIEYYLYFNENIDLEIIKILYKEVIYKRLTDKNYLSEYQFMN